VDCPNTPDVVSQKCGRVAFKGNHSARLNTCVLVLKAKTHPCVFRGRNRVFCLLIGTAVLQAETDGLLWGMDRSTFRRIILQSRIERRERFEETLQNMSVFASLTANQRASIADCLELEVFEVPPPLPLPFPNHNPALIPPSQTQGCYRNPKP